MPEWVSGFSWIDLLDISIIYYILYRILLFIRGTRSIQMATGLGIIVAGFAFSYVLKLYAVQWFLSNFMDVAIIAVIIIFSDDIRRALTSVGKHPFFKALSTIQGSQMMDEIIKAIYSMASKKTGALVVLERHTGLKNYLEIGTVIDAKISSGLITSIFSSKESHLHDGAIIIQNGRISAAGCFLPLTLKPEVPKDLGTRHRAALGLTEETDAVVIVVSEEKGHVSIVTGGNMIRNISRSDLTSLIGRLFSIKITRGENLYETYDAVKEAEEKHES